MRLFFLLALLFVICMCTTKEPFVEMFGFSGYFPPKEVSLDMTPPDLSGYVLSKKQITPDEVQSVVIPSQKFFSKRTGLYVYAVDTSEIQKYISEKSVAYKARFMFTTTKQGFPYGIGCTFYVVDGVVVSAVTQQVGGTGLEPYKEETGTTFLPFNDIVSGQRKVILN